MSHKSQPLKNNVFGTLNKSEFTFQQLLEVLPDAVVAVNTAGEIQFANTQAQKLFGYQLEELQGKPVELLIPTRFNNHLDHREAYVANPHTRPMGVDLELSAQQKEGVEFPVEIALSPLETTAGTLVIAIIRDVTERKQADERYRNTLDNMLEGCQIIDFDWRYVYVNVAAARQGHSKPEDLLQRTMMEAYPGIEKTELFRVLRRCMEERLPQNMENVFTFPDGGVGWFDLRIQPVPEGLFILSIDITKRKHAEEALTASEDRYRDLVEHSQDLICTHDLDGYILSVNPFAEHSLGYSTDDLLQMNLRDILAPEAHSALDKYLTDIKENGHAKGTMLVQTKAGEQRVWEFNNTLRTEGVDVPLVRGMARDVTEAYRFEKALREERDRFAKLAATAPGVICSFRMKPDGSFSMPYASPAIEDVYGLKAEDLVNDFSAAMIRIHPDDVEKVNKTVAESARTLTPWRTEFRFNHPQKGEVWIGSHSMPIKEPDGSIIWHGFISDISERKRAEMEIIRQSERVKALRNIDIAISSSMDLKLVLNVILREVASQLGSDAGDILLLERYTQELEFGEGFGFRSPQKQDSRLRLGQGLAGKVALKRKLISIPDLEEHDDFFTRRGLFNEEGFVTYFGVPLVAKGKLTGVLEVFHRSHFSPEPGWSDFLEALAGQAAIAIDNATLFDDLQRSNIELMMAYDKTLEGWSAALDLRDEETEGHTQRVTEMTVKLAEKMGISKRDLVYVRRGALLHDIGKMGIPDHILLKPGKLTDEEWETMRKHPIYAYELLKPIEYLGPALDIPYCHHEKWDGSGYPRGLAGENIPLAARIFAIVDIYDALTSNRPYRAAWSKEKTLEHIQSLSGSHLDPEVVKAFLNFINGS